MDLRMLSLLYSKDAIERAKKRGRAYLCLTCQRQTGEKRIGEPGPMEDHIMKTHVGRDRVPFYCRLCTFKCMTMHQMTHHINHYTRHMARAREMGVTNHKEWMVVSPIPYKIGETDLLKFSQEESLLFFLKKQSGESIQPTATVSQVPAASPDQLACEPGGYVSASPVAAQPSAIVSVPDSRGSQLGQTPAFKLISGPAAGLVPHVQNPTSQEGVQSLSFSTPQSQLMSGLGQWTAQSTIIPHLQNVLQQSDAFAATPVVRTYLQPSQFPASPLACGNLASAFHPIHCETPATHVAATPPVVSSHLPSFLTVQQLSMGAETNGLPASSGTTVLRTSLGLPPAASLQSSPVATLGNPFLTLWQPAEVKVPNTLQEVISQTTPSALLGTPAPAASERSDLETSEVVPSLVSSPPSPEVPLGSPSLTVLQPALVDDADSLESLQTDKPVKSNSTLLGPIAPVTKIRMEEESSEDTPMRDPRERETSRQIASEEQAEVQPLPSCTSAGVEDSQQKVGAVEGGESLEDVEDLWPQLMPSGELDSISEIGETDRVKRKAVSGGEDGAKKRRLESTVEGASEEEEGTSAKNQVGSAEGQNDPQVEGSTDWKSIRQQIESTTGPTLEVSLVTMNGLVAAIQSGNRQNSRTEKALDKVEKALTEVTCMLGKVVDSLNKLRNAVEENTGEDKRREERWFEIERKREEERRKEIEAERRREDRRRDAEKKEREEIRKLLARKDTETVETKKDTTKADKKKDAVDKEEKENHKKEMKSVLGKSYTQNTIRDHN